VKNLLPLVSTAFFYLLFYLISGLKFDVWVVPQIVPYDYLLQATVGYILFALSRDAKIFLVIQGLLMALLYVGNAVKISFFGGPIMPDDVFALRSLLLILEGWQFFAAALPLAAIASLLVFNLYLKHWSSYFSCLTLTLLALTLVYKPEEILKPIDDQFGHSVWDQRSNYLWHGATLFSIQEGARYFADVELLPDRDKAQLAADNLLAAVDPPVAEQPPAFTPRNIHIVLLESFWDPGALKKARYDRDPMPRDFREFWKRSGNSKALSPVFGGYTANSEFEMLCGFPVVKDSVKFERRLLNDVPCLPHILAERGYWTVASHPNVPVFWNRVNAYRRIGFKTYWALDDFVLDDMNREFLSDKSLYRQVLDKVSSALASRRPILNYIVTYFGHWNYPLSADRPNRIKTASEVEEAFTYANTVYYKARELMEFLKQLRERDPDGIIVVFGDHLPFLGENFAGYVESKVLASSRSDFTPEMFRFYVSTPMLVIDGNRGPLKIGSLPIYQVPKLLLDLLHFDERTIMDFTQPPAGMRVRPLPGLHFDLLDNGKIAVCKEPPFRDEACQRSARWLEDVLTVSTDLFIGSQHTRPLPHREGESATPFAQVPPPTVPTPEPRATQAK
jgi:phosphoglycerol transferase MdoB-like AlkP superfamily enzyme